MEKDIEDLSKKLSHIQSSLKYINAGLHEPVSYVLLEHWAKIIGVDLKAIIEKYRPRDRGEP